MSKHPTIAHKIQAKKTSVHTEHNSESHELNYITPRLQQISSRLDTVSPDGMNAPKRNVEASQITSEATSVPNLSRRSFSFSQRDIILITLGVLLALGTAITAIALAIKYRT
ncbi:unnamed protein product [Rotaria magnacalcarata]|uniref:Uncharacterized protein n=1 Tax=Rotaria magnacalcarata TaxID=392030 RepID=A0A816NZX4_9BILA|nr:unnamed protein product [Rotaria magnacalcarata]CAF1491595.1 unnamed protein product [Rotaria magnacalcarata]CAF2042001.1 unnamed protein product [Rotaria magnacalcarata]CAF2055881.1 unnamed protein product [Rotaria magnacalcarata]CAF2238144.1 unnamed protein product [Rotaria magnacalcarata]